ncbi:BPTI/Kunitz domain-containing protein-like [Amblyomma americanum]
MKICRDDPVVGPCRAHISRWWYNGEWCEEFFYGGCKGNLNNFESLDQCQKACGAAFYFENPGVKICADPERKEECRELCSKMPDEGPCRALIPGWYFNGISCQKFTYGGCGDDYNNFDSDEECMEACGNYTYSRLNMTWESNYLGNHNNRTQ